MIRLKGVRVDVTCEEEILTIILKKTKLKKEDIKGYKIHHKSLDARNKKYFAYVYDFDIELVNEEAFLKNTKLKNVGISEIVEYKMPKLGNTLLKRSPIVIGAGPAGLFAAYFLSLAGFKPILFERGKKIEDRVKIVEEFWQTGKLNPKCNVQFGEGGAGTFSDGKLNTLVKDKEGRKQKVLEVLVKYGAPADILYEAKPHIGTDVLRSVIIAMRRDMQKMGCEIHYDSLMEDITIKNNRVTNVVVNGTSYATDVLVLAIGHSARDTFNMLLHHQIDISAKPFAIGIRIMHPQKMIDEAQYPVLVEGLAPATYKLTYQAKSGRGVYSFCMCPGGYVVNASSEEGHLVINGMSNRARESGYANSAIIVSVSPSDFGTLPLAGLDFLEDIEKKAYMIGNGLIPTQRFIDYENNQVSHITANLKIKGEYVNANINEIYPKYINDALKEGINYFGTKIKGFNGPDAIIMAPESRTSSPVRINRSEDFESNIKGIYPCGEGSGYAGGITTSAIDGIKVFEAIASKYHPQ